MNNRRLLPAAIALVVVAAVGSTANAQLGRKLLEGISIPLSPTLGQPANGPLADQNIFRQRFLRNYFGDGYGYEFTRTFGPDSYGNVNQFDFGSLGSAAFQGSVHNRIEINRRIMPQIQLQMDTAGSPLQYNINTAPGGQTFTFSGAISSNVTASINALGFYNLQVSASNTGTSRLEGYVVTDQQSTDFDIGPINVTGNIYIDLAASLIQAIANTPLASSAADVPSNATGKAKNADGTPISIDASGLSDQQIAEMLGHALIQSMFSQALSDLTHNELLTLQSALGLTPEDAQKGLTAAGYASAATPEPSTIALLAVPAVLAMFRRRK